MRPMSPDVQGRAVERNVMRQAQPKRLAKAGKIPSDLADPDLKHKQARCSPLHALFRLSSLVAAQGLQDQGVTIIAGTRGWV